MKVCMSQIRCVYNIVKCKRVVVKHEIPFKHSTNTFEIKQTSKTLSEANEIGAHVMMTRV